MPSAVTSDAWGRPPDEVSPPAKPVQCAPAARPRTERASEGPALDAFRAIAARAGRALGVAWFGGGGGDRGMRVAGLVVVWAGTVGANRCGRRYAAHDQLPRPPTPPPPLRYVGPLRG